MREENEDLPQPLKGQVIGICDPTVCVETGFCHAAERELHEHKVELANSQQEVDKLQHEVKELRKHPEQEVCFQRIKASFQLLSPQ